MKADLRAAGEELDASRKARQAEHLRLMLTQMYNVRKRIRAIERAGRVPSPSAGEGQGGGTAACAVVVVVLGDGAVEAASSTGAAIAGLPPTPAFPRKGGGSAAPLTAEEERIKGEGLIVVLNELHDRIDRLTLQAYGWPEGLSDEAILERLVALNGERAAEERRGIVRWLRPEYQKARAGVVEIKAEQLKAELVVPAAARVMAAFPKDAVEQAAAVAAALSETGAGAGTGITAEAIAARFKGGKRATAKIGAILAAFVRMGFASTADGGRTFQARRVA